MSDNITLRDSMTLDTFDPMDIDISEFRELSKELPKDVSLDLAMAEHLAVVYLRAADRCSEIHSNLIWYVGKLKIDKNTMRQKFYLLSIDEGYKTINDRNAYAESHPDFIDVSNRLIGAEAVRKWFEDKHKWFLESHRFMKAKLKSESSLLNSSSFSETTGSNYALFGEKEWTD